MTVEAPGKLNGIVGGGKGNVCCFGVLLTETFTFVFSVSARGRLGKMRCPGQTVVPLRAPSQQSQPSEVPRSVLRTWPAFLFLKQPGRRPLLTLGRPSGRGLCFYFVRGAGGSVLTRVSLQPPFHQGGEGASVYSGK